FSRVHAGGRAMRDGRFGRAPARAGTLVAALLLGPGLLAATEDDKTRWSYVDLQPFGNHKLDDDMSQFEGNNFKSLPKGEQGFEGTKFKVGEKMIRLKGDNADDALPDKVERIKVEAPVDQLDILHATEYSIDFDPENDGDESAREIGAYVV